MPHSRYRAPPLPLTAAQSRLIHQSSLRSFSLRPLLPFRHPFWDCVNSAKRSGDFRLSPPLLNSRRHMMRKLTDGYKKSRQSLMRTRKVSRVSGLITRTTNECGRKAEVVKFPRILHVASTQRVGEDVHVHKTCNYVIFRLSERRRFMSMATASRMVGSCDGDPELARQYPRGKRS